jgi:hypothetical protein
MKGNIGLIRKRLFNNLISAKDRLVLNKLGDELDINKVLNP